MDAISPTKIEKKASGNVVFYTGTTPLRSVDPNSICINHYKASQKVIVKTGSDEFEFDILALSTLTLRGSDTTLTLPDKTDDSDIRDKRDSILETLVTDYFTHSSSLGITDLGENAIIATADSWTLDSGDLYYTEISHNLSTQHCLVNVYDSSTNEKLIPESIEAVDSNTIKIENRNNTDSFTVVIIAGNRSVGSASPYTIATTSKDGGAAYNTYLLVDATSGPISINLPSATLKPSEGLVVKKTDSSVNAVTVRAASGEQVEFASTQSLASQGDKVDIFSDGSQFLER